MNERAIHGHALSVMQYDAATPELVEDGSRAILMRGSTPRSNRVRQSGMDLSKTAQRSAVAPARSRHLHGRGCGNRGKACVRERPGSELPALVSEASGAAARYQSVLFDSRFMTTFPRACFCPK
jgi:hypothetical protein